MKDSSYRLSKTLKVWIERIGIILDKDSDVDAGGVGRFYIKTLDPSSSTVEVGINKEVSLEEYQQGYIGKYVNDIKSWMNRFLQQYALTNNLTLVIDPLSFKNNAEKLYEEFDKFCTKNRLKPLLKPTMGSTSIVYEEFNSANIEDSLRHNPNINEYLLSTIDWYNAGLIQTKTSNQFLHYFIPLEILASKFLKDLGISWKSENEKEYERIKKFLERILKHEKYSNKLDSLIRFSLYEFSFTEKIKRYFESIFTKDEILKFWQDSSDITFNGRWIWNQYRLMSLYKENADKVDLFRVLRDLYRKRNEIVHQGIENIASEDIFMIENILRRVLRKEINKAKGK